MSGLGVNFTLASYLMVVLFLPLASVGVVNTDAHWLLLDLGQLDSRDPAASTELQQRIETAIRARYPLLEDTSRLGGPQSSHFTLSNTPRRALWTDE